MKNLKLTTFFLSVFLAGQAQTKNFIDQPYIEVSGSADTLITPDEIYIRITIAEKDNRDRISVEELEVKMISALKTLGLDTEKDLTVNDMSSNFRFYILKSKDVLKTRRYMLKVGDAVTAGKVFIALEESGISNTSIDRVNHSGLENIRNLMRAKAVANAKARAAALTKPLNQAVGPAIHIADNENYSPNNLLEGRAEGVVVVGYGVQRKVMPDLPRIEFEKIKVAATIGVKFLLK